MQITLLWYLRVMTLVLLLIDTINVFEILVLIEGDFNLPKRTYEIRVEGLLGDDWMRWFEGLTISHHGPNQTLLTGLLDQAMLRGILMRISDLGLNLVSVQPMEQDDKEI